MTTTDYKAFLEHVCLIAIRAKDKYYCHSAHVDYVLVVRRMAEKQGFAAFSKENSGESVVHYRPQNMLTCRTHNNAYKKCYPVSLENNHVFHGIRTQVVSEQRTSAIMRMSVLNVGQKHIEEQNA